MNFIPQIYPSLNQSNMTYLPYFQGGNYSYVNNSIYPAFPYSVLNYSNYSNTVQPLYNYTYPSYNLPNYYNQSIQYLNQSFSQNYLMNFSNGNGY